MRTDLQHDAADVVDALCDGVARACDGDGSLRTVRQHVAGHLYAGPCHLPDLLDLGASLADQRSALRRWDDEAQSDGWPRAPASSTTILHLLKLFNITTSIKIQWDS